MYCTQCGARNREEEEACWQCQARLTRRRQTVPGQSRRTDPEMEAPWTPSQNRGERPPDAAPAGNTPRSTEGYEPYQSQLQGPWGANDPQQSQAFQSPASSRSIIAMVLSILGVIGCGPLSALPGLLLGWFEMKAIKEGRSSLAGDGYAKVGFYLGLIVTALALLAGVLWFFSLLAWLI